MKYLLASLVLFASFALGNHAQAAEQTMCYDLYKPVCAAEPVQCFAAPCYPQYHTYSNDCFASSSNAAIIHDGECTTSESGSVLPATSTPESPAPYVPPASCIAWFDGCNSCSKNGNGSMCTQMACLTKAAGYCREYAPVTPTSTPVTTHPHPVQPATTTTIGTSTSSPMATSSAPTPVHGFFYNIWHTLLSWFGIN